MYIIGPRKFGMEVCRKNGIKSSATAAGKFGNMSASAEKNNIGNEGSDLSLRPVRRSVVVRREQIVYLTEPE
jgi:hypothetical protein